MTEHAHIDASDIEVEVEDGEVTLTGTVADRETKKRAEDAIDNLSGVKHVQNNLRVKDQSGSQNGMESTTSGRGRSGSSSSSKSKSSA